VKDSRSDHNNRETFCHSAIKVLHPRAKGDKGRSTFLSYVKELQLAQIKTI
jgi:hypothetical protein